MCADLQFSIHGKMWPQLHHQFTTKEMADMENFQNQSFKETKLREEEAARRMVDIREAKFNEECHFHRHLTGLIRWLIIMKKLAAMYATDEESEMKVQVNMTRAKQKPSPMSC